MAGQNGGVDLWVLPLSGDKKSAPFLQSPFRTTHPQISPDGKWVAYASNETGRMEIYVRPFPSGEGKWQISTSGGRFPRWSRNGKELFYRTEDSKIMMTTYTTSGDSFRADKPQLWSPGQFTDFLGGISNLDLHPDGKRFAVLRALGTEQATAVNKVDFIFNFFDELRRRVPAGTK